MKKTSFFSILERKVEIYFRSLWLKKWKKTDEATLLQSFGPFSENNLSQQANKDRWWRRLYPPQKSIIWETIQTPKSAIFVKSMGEKCELPRKGKKILFLTRWAAIQACLLRKGSKVSFSLMKNVMPIHLSIWSRPLFAPFYKGRMK